MHPPPPMKRIYVTIGTLVFFFVPFIVEATSSYEFIERDYRSYQNNMLNSNLDQIRWELQNLNRTLQYQNKPKPFRPWHSLGLENWAKLRSVPVTNGACKQKFGDSAESNGNNGCRCMNGFIWSKDETECVFPGEPKQSISTVACVKTPKGACRCPTGYRRALSAGKLVCF